MDKDKKEKPTKLGYEFFSTLIQLSTAGFAFVAALAWNETIKAFIDHFLPEGDGFYSKLIYALIVTALAVIVTTELGRVAERLKLIDEDELKEKVKKEIKEEAK